MSKYLVSSADFFVITNKTKKIKLVFEKAFVFSAITYSVDFS